jgi:hypothetical protein
VLPILNLALAGGLDRWTRRRLGRTHALALAVLLLPPGPLYAVYKVHERGWLPVTRQERQDYLARLLPGYGAIRWLNDERGADYAVYALFAPSLRYHADGRYLGDLFSPWSYRRLISVLGDSRALYAELEAAGASHFLLRRLTLPATTSEDGFFQRCFRLVWQDSEAVLYEVVGKPSPPAPLPGGEGSKTARSVASFAEGTNRWIGVGRAHP